MHEKEKEREQAEKVATFFTIPFRTAVLNPCPGFQRELLSLSLGD
jgi:hypothetical protein